MSENKEIVEVKQLDGEEDENSVAPKSKSAKKSSPSKTPIKKLQKKVLDYGRARRSLRP